jgi:leucyl/phenylalanyl-tRNA--protein transferase
MSRVTPEMLLRAYALGVFPMAEGRENREIYWIDPEERGVLPLDALHVPRRLLRTLRQKRFEVRCDTAFGAVVQACAEPGPGRNDTWINQEILRLSLQLYDMGFAHSVECWSDGKLAGGLYGVAIGGAFFGESMFSRQTDSSKVALVHLVLRLRLGGFQLLDTQFVTRHLQRFGAVEIPRAEYRRRLMRAIASGGKFYSEVSDSELDAFLQSITHRS